LNDGSVWIWDAQTGTAVGKPLTGHSDYVVLSVAISSDGARIVSGSLDGMVRIWDVGTGEKVGNPLQGHTNPVISVVFSPDGRYAVSGSQNDAIRIWDAATGEQLRTLRVHHGIVWSLATNGRYVVSGSEDWTVKIWDIVTGEQVGEPLRGHMRGVNSVAISDARGWIISGSADQTVRIWDIETRGLVRQLDAKDSVYSVALSDEGNTIAAAADETVLIWDMNALDTEPLLLHSLINSTVSSVALSRDGHLLSVSGEMDITMRVCDIDIERIVAGNTTLRGVLDKRLDVLTSLTSTGKRLLHRMSSLPFLLVRIVFGRSAFVKIDNAATTLLQFFHDTYARDNIVDSDRQCGSIEVLLDALALCRSTETDRKTFAELSLRGFIIESGKQVPMIRKAAKEVLRKFCTGA
jgi:WD40 repeat protein